MRRVSHSEVKMFQRCRRKWWLTHYRRLQPLAEKKAGAAALGTRVHEALEVLYEVGAEPALAHLEAAINADADEFPEQADAIRKDGDLALAMVEGYVEWTAETGEDEDIELVETESTAAVAHPELEGVELVGKLDQRIRRISTSERMFLDHKTVDDFSRVGLLHQDTQMKQYHLLEYLEMKAEGADAEHERTGGALYNMLRKVKRTGRAKPPFYMRVEVRHNLTTLRHYYAHVTAVIREILSTEKALDAEQSPAEVAYPNPTRDCSWDCEFLTVCGQFDDGSDVEGTVSLIYREGDPMARYSGS